MDFWWYRNAIALVELCVFLSFSLFEGKKQLKIDTFVELHMQKFLENATVEFLFLFENIILLQSKKICTTYHYAPFSSCICKQNNRAKRDVFHK